MSGDGDTERGHQAGTEGPHPAVGVGVGLGAEVTETEARSHMMEGPAL